ncbi:Metallo-hydrolase/oxidoreductase [Xylariomycetidae sp. FL0641]|nr:Metallo-hydrolase/oxidoreductase [Xylariomycetidae sp. FL0641]
MGASDGTTTPGTTPTNDGTTTANPTIDAVYEPATGTWQYLVSDAGSRTAVLIDPVLDYDAGARAVATATADALLARARARRLRVAAILETHVHADHLSAAAYLQARLAAAAGERPPIGIGRRIQEVQRRFAHVYQVPQEAYRGAFDRLFDDDEVVRFGGLQIQVWHLPGHTPDHIGYRIGDNIFCGDSLFQADLGSARADFPGGSARALFRSGRRLLTELPGHARVWTGHGYGDHAAPDLSVAEHRARNAHLHEGVGEDDFVALREARDRQLKQPGLIHESLQWNIGAGRWRLGDRDGVGRRMFRLPVSLGEGVDGW